MAKKIGVHLAFIIDYKIVESKAMFVTQEKAMEYAKRQGAINSELVGFYLTLNGVMKSPYYLFGTVCSVPEVLREPFFRCYDSVIYSMLYNNILIVAGGYVVRPPKNSKILFRAIF